MTVNVSTKKAPANNPEITVIGSGSWGTAILKVLEQNGYRVNWWVRKKESIRYIRQHHRNPRYLSSLELDLSRINPSSNLKELVGKTKICFLAIPSSFLKDSLKSLSTKDFKDKLVVSAIKGIVPEKNQLVSEFMQETYHVPDKNFINLSGPSHAEEVAFERLTFLTLAGTSSENVNKIRELLENHFLNIRRSDDVTGLEYAAVFKNIYAIASGMANSLGYGDNFQAVLVAAATREMKHFLDKVAPQKRNILESGYLGDLLVTAYSQFSRNRTFGNMLGKGYSVKSALLEMNMIPEGYYAIVPAYEKAQKNKVEEPILKAIYHVLHENISPVMEVKILAEKLS